MEMRRQGRRWSEVAYSASVACTVGIGAGLLPPKTLPVMFAVAVVLRVSASPDTSR